MRNGRRFVRVGLAVLIIPIFLATALLSNQQPALSQTTASGSPSLDVPEDPLGNQSEQQAPEISISVDVRDGHLIARVVDVWGPGRAPLVMRSWTGVGNSPSGAGYWQFNHHLGTFAPNTCVGCGYPSYPNMYMFQPDGNLASYKYSTGSYVYVKNMGTYSSLTAGVNCWPRSTREGGDVNVCNPTGNNTAYFPKGVTLTFADNSGASAYTCPPSSCNPSSSQGLITQEKDANGNVTTYAWTSLPSQVQAYIASVTDPVGRVTTYGYEAYNSVCLHETVETGLCTVWATYYRVNKATDPYGEVATYTYNASGQLASVTNAAGFTTQYSYNVSSGGLLSSVTDANGNTTTITWTATSPLRVAQVTAPDGKGTTYNYTTDSSGNVTGVTVTDARNNVTKYAVVTTGTDANITSITDPRGNITQFSYDANHNVTQVTDARGVINTYAYNTHNKVTQVVLASGSLNLTTNLSWDSPDTPPLKDNLLTLTSPRGISTNCAYDSYNNLIKVDRAVGTPDEAVTQYTYTTWGGVASAIDPQGNTITYAYTARHQIQTVTPPAGGATTYGYDSYDNPVSKADGNGYTWTTAYNSGRLPTTVADPLGNTVSYAYDANSNRTSATDPKSQTTTFTYDSRNRLTAITDSLNGTTGYQYDAVGNLVTITNARNFSTTFAYDPANRLSQVTDALGQAATYGYDQVGNRVSMIDRKGVTTTYTYDPANRLTQVSAVGITISYTYDANGNRLTMTDPTGTTNYTHDNLGRLTGTTYPDGRSVQFAYDKAGNRTSLVYPGGTASLSYAYDAANRLTQVAEGTLQWAFAYDGAGNRTQLTRPNGTQTAYTYLANNWLASITHQNTVGAFATISYAYDANGNRVSETDSSGTTTFSYDALNRVTQAAYPGTYGTWSWTYDAVGNRTSQTSPSGQIAYTYDGNNRLTQAGATVYTYDANGNLTGTPSNPYYTYDAFNRLIQAGAFVTYTYNGDGLKVQRVGPDGTTRYYYDDIWSIWESDATGGTIAELDRDIFGNLLSRLDSSGTRLNYHTDGLGSTIALTDTTGNVAASMLYDAWGNVRASGADVGKYRFTGAEFDAVTGLYHMGARFYDPSIGRWLSEDPIQNKFFEPFTLNFYAYVNDNPALLVDPRGRNGYVGVLEWGLAGVSLAIPGLDAWVAIGAIAVLVGDALMMSPQTDKRQTAGLAKQVAQHLADYLNEPVAGVQPRPDKDRTYPEKYKEQAEHFLDDASKKAGRDWGKFERSLRDQGWTEEQIKDFVAKAEKAGIDFGNYFNNPPEKGQPGPGEPPETYP